MNHPPEGSSSGGGGYQGCSAIHAALPEVAVWHIAAARDVCVMTAVGAVVIQDAKDNQTSTATFSSCPPEHRTVTLN